MFVHHKSVNLDPRHTLLVRGPALVTSYQDVTVLGKRLIGKVRIRPGKVLPFESDKDSRIRIDIALHRHGKCWTITDRQRLGVSIWNKVVNRMREMAMEGRVMLLGANDTGKSTLSTYLSNLGIEAGRNVALLDSDLGQGDITPPGSVGAANIHDQFLDLRELVADRHSFIGTLSPMHVEKYAISRILDAADRIANNSELCIINTDGYIEGYGLNYKLDLVNRLEPDLLVSLGKMPKFITDIETIHVDAPKGLEKTRSIREERRLEQYRRFVGNNIRAIDTEDISFSFLGRPLKKVSSSELEFDNASFSIDVLNGMFVGLAEEQKVRGFGVITDVEEGELTIRTSYTDRLDTLLLSTIGISPDMKDEYQIYLFF